MSAHTHAASFATRLREATSRHHEQAESGTFVTDLLAGHLPLTAYAALASQHWFIYEALERVAATYVDDPLAGPFIDTRVHRLAHLHDDLAYLFGDEWGEAIDALPATQRYVARIEAAAASPAAFIAHHYTRYLGDLSGGQAIASRLRRTLDLPDTTGTAFYVFDGIGTPREWKDRYRSLLDAADFTPAQQQELIDETGVAYACNTAVFADLESAVARAAP